jgi:branched-chain amino acid transport system substrate-binding protein
MIMSHRLRWFVLSVLVLSAGALGSAAAQAPPSGGKPVITVGAEFSLSGPYAQFGQAGLAGVELAVDEINRRGGLKIGGTTYMVDIAREDTRSQASDTVTAAERLVRERKVPVLFGPIVGVLAMPAQEVTQPAKVIHVSPAIQWRALVGQPAKKWIINSQVDDHYRYGYFVPVLVRETKVKTVAMLAVNDATARGIIPRVTELMAKEGVKVVATEYFERGTTDFSPFLTRIRGAKPDMLFFGYGDAHAVSILRQGVELNVAPHYGSFAGTSVLVPFQTALGKPVDSFVGVASNENLSHPIHDNVRAWVQAYKTKYGKDVTGQTEWALSMYDYVLMWGKAVEQAGTYTDNDKVIDRLRGMTHRGVMTVKIDERGQAIHDFDIAIIREGKIQWQHASIVK